MSTGLENHPHVAAMMQEDHPPGIDQDAEVIDPSKDNIEKKILHLLAIYPKLSPSMMQVALGTSLPPITWKPILEQMVIKGLIQRSEQAATTPGGRYQVYRIISLAPTSVVAA